VQEDLLVMLTLLYLGTIQGNCWKICIQNLVCRIRIIKYSRSYFA